MKSEMEIRNQLKTMKKTVRWNKSIAGESNFLVQLQERDVVLLKWVLEDEN